MKGKSTANFAFAAGEVDAESELQNDLLDGETVDYFPNGKVSQRLHFAAGKMHGLLRRFDDQGVQSLSLRIKGELHGDLLTYENGQMVSQQHYVKGRSTASESSMVQTDNRPFGQSSERQAAR